MVIKRRIKKYGGSYCVHIEQEDLERLQAEIGDLVNIEKMEVLSNDKFETCEICREKFELDELDLVNGVLMCRNCEENQNI